MNDETLVGNKNLFREMLRGEKLGVKGGGAEMDWSGRGRGRKSGSWLRPRAAVLPTAVKVSGTGCNTRREQQ